jgi:hypothetical protein
MKHTGERCKGTAMKFDLKRLVAVATKRTLAERDCECTRGFVYFLDNQYFPKGKNQKYGSVF